jgi:hypothetical protein
MYYSDRTRKKSSELAWYVQQLRSADLVGATILSIDYSVDTGNAEEITMRCEWPNGTVGDVVLSGGEGVFVEVERPSGSADE